MSLCGLSFLLLWLCIATLEKSCLRSVAVIKKRERTLVVTLENNWVIFQRANKSVNGNNLLQLALSCNYFPTHYRLIPI